MADEKRCAQCGAVLPADAPQGLCPACLLKRGFATGSSASALNQERRAEYIPPTPVELARYFPGLEILELIGRGGMGAVYKARQKRLDRFVALKVLPFSVSRDPAFAERFAREARALARLTHPNIVTVHDFGQTDGLYYFVMEFVDGLNLRQLLNAGKIAPKEALAIVPQICDALQYAHDKGIVHRDIKPENLLIDKTGTVKIADFGLAKLIGLEAKDLRITGSGDVMGTPHYMAPEQVEHPQDVDHRADIYSLGVVFYQMLTGELPIGRFAAPSHKVQIDVRLDEVVLRALEKEPALRFQQASEVKTQVETIITTPPTEEQKNAAALIPKGRFGRVVLVGACNGKRVINWTGVIQTWVVIYGAMFIGLYIAFGRYVPFPDLIASLVGGATLVTATLIQTRLKTPIEQLTPIAAAKTKALFSHTANKLINGSPTRHASRLALGKVAVFFGGLSGVLGIVTFYLAPQPPEILVWSILVSALACLGLGVASRATPLGKRAIVGGSIGVTIWLILFAAFNLLSEKEPHLSVTGRVTDAVTGGPIPHARVDDNRYGASPTRTPQQAWTDADGRYELKTWPEEHGIAASAPGYESKLTTLMTTLLGREREARMDFQLQPTNAPGALGFGPTIEQVLPASSGRIDELLDLDTGHNATSTNFGANDRETHAWIRKNHLDVLGVVEKGQIAVLCCDMAVVPTSSNRWDAITSSEVVTNWGLNQQEPKPVTAISPVTDNTDTWFFRTREGGMGILQIAGENPDPDGVKIRYKLVQRRD